MADELNKVHLHYDEINKIRVIDNTVLKETEDLKNSCKDYETSNIFLIHNIVLRMLLTLIYCGFYLNIELFVILVILSRFIVKCATFLYTHAYIRNLFLKVVIYDFNSFEQKYFDLQQLGRFFF